MIPPNLASNFYDVNMSTKSKTASEFSHVSFGEIL